MKRYILLLSLLTVGWTSVHAQLPPGTVAPDFNAEDINGNTYNLYTLLNEGKTVYLDMFATWCGPCWSYHNGHALANIFEEYGPNGTQEAFVFAIECDPSTNVQCISGPSGCVGGTQGDWTDGTPYPIVNDHTIGDLYNVNYYPTIYMICPADKKIYEPGQLNMQALWNYRDQFCEPVSVALAVNNVNNVRCFGTSTGSIDLTVVSGGVPPYTYAWSNGATTQDLNNIPAGTYTCVVTSSNGWTGTTDPIDVLEPGEPLSLAVVETTLVGCNGNLGSATVAASGGWNAEYMYKWNNGQLGETAFSLGAGTYTCSVTDDNGCVKTTSVTLAPPVYPTAAIAPPGQITCTNSSIQLSGSGSSNGSEYTYQWFASNGGNIVSGGNTLTPTVNAAGNYTLQVTNTGSTCASYASTAVTSNIALPLANAGPAMSVSCTQSSVNLDGSGSTGSNFTYLWTASSGGNITSGAGTLAPTVNAAGTYTLKVTDSSNGCTQTSATTVSGNNVPPTVTSSNGTVSCAINNTVLTTTTNAGNPTFVWSGPDNFTSTDQNPTVTLAGTYTVVVTEPASNCTNTSVSTVTANTTAPGATATGGTLTCAVNTVTLSGTSQGTDVTWTWTGPGGFSSNAQNPATTTNGDYSLVVMDTMNGCTSTANTTVNLNNTQPAADAQAAGNLNCNTSQLQLNGTGSSQGTNYSYIWSTGNGHIVSGETTLTPLVDQTGDYTIVVTNTDNGCSNTDAITVNQTPPVVAGIAAQNNVTCNSATNGSATASGTGGNGSFTFAWSNGETTATITGLAAGTYVVVVTDGENCTASSTVVITQPDVLFANVSATSQTNNGINDGTATAVPTGGTAPYSYLWSNNEMTQTITELAPGTYTATVTDVNGCTSIETTTVNSFNCALSGNATGTNATCFGAGNGTASVAISGASDPISFNWSDGQTASTAINLTPGLYTVSITDGNNCPATYSVSITEPLPLLTNATSTHETSSGAQDGTATASPTGGNGNFSYLWSNGETTPSIAGLAPGVYTVSVTDQNGCTAIQTVNVNSFDCNIVASITGTSVTCFGASNGIATVVLNGGSAPYTYAWNNGGSSATIENLSGGIYVVSVTDDNDCQTTQTVTINEPGILQVNVTEITHVECANSTEGSIAVVADGGAGNYSYLWSNGSSEAIAANLTAGDYSVVVTDQNGCTQSIGATVTASDLTPPVVSAQAAEVELGPDGTAEVTLTDLNVIASDNCETAQIIINPAVFDCDDLGTHEVTVTVFDGAGNSAATITTVNILDNMAPVVTCPASITQCSYDNIVSYPAPVAVDNCLGAGGGWSQDAGLASGAEFPVGATTQTFSYKDASGNTGSCSFDVIITEPVNISLVNLVNDTDNQGIGSIDVQVTGGTEPYEYIWTRNEQIIGTTQDLSNLTAGLYNIQVIDANGCEYLNEGIQIDNTTGISEPEWMTGVQIRPNPTAGIAQVVFKNLPDTQVEIAVIDATGRVVFSTINEQQNVIRIDCTNLPGGIYSVRFRTGTELGMRKLAVQR